MNMNTPHNTHPTKSDRTNASAATAKRSWAASLGRLWMIGWLVVAIALVAVSLRKSGEAPEQVASSESAIQDAANLDRTVTPVSYEAAEKKLRSKLIHTFQPIEALRVGDRVIADNPDTETPEATAVDPKTWRLVKLYAEERWPDGTLDTIHIESLQPPVWFELLGAEVGSEVPPPLDLVEMGLPEELRTKVTAIEPCPPIQIGNGRVVLTTVNHLNNDVWELAAVNSAGKLEKLRPTGLHKFYSETRGDWVSTKQIHDNEVIRGRAGPLTIVDSRPLEGTQRVYNLTVEGEHVYYVSELGLLAHNNWCGGRQATAPSRQLLANRSGVLQSRAGELARVDILDGVTGLTQQGNRVAAGIRRGDLGLNVLGDDLFESAYRLKGGNGGAPQAFAYGEQIFVRRNASNILSEVVHEGTHGLDFLRGYNGSVLQLENRAYFYERQFQRAGGGNVEFDSVNDMLQFIRDEY